ncbi:SusD/RagB family nutrient-binding outer membrane lipoprotein [Pontibacter actiniarum]|uniref:SusD/RagB family nutrient-binding outer membrane lipoprotein n=1 Tax=Pontibacter actiniarum TaxID=323450 RepID=A0A1X9YRJ3_9BACT|nr:SusD/RagB family nutrient-binding outer membrane lipoprotein [Pontibacter actiniarum]ARS35510.1 SusD/RagB family nutrient-binding outer membrane lipoprotein [Pontibacter actiniarum]
MKKLIIFALACFAFTGCNKFDEELSVNPNQPSEASNTQLLANSMMYLPGTSSSPYGPLYAQHLSETEYTDASRYNSVYFNFYNYYTGPLMNIESVLASNELDVSEGPVPNQLAMAKVLKSYFFWHMTDRWGPLPYEQALQGKENFTPAYNSQETIYNALFTLLDEANAEMVPGVVDNDIMYSGNPDKWRKLANTIHLLMALRLSEVAPDKAKAEFNKALEGGIMTSNADNFVYPHLSNTDNQNYWYEVFEVLNRKWYAVSKPLVDYMKPLGDPRLGTFAEPNSQGEYVGLKYGLPGDVANTGEYSKKNISMLGESLRQQNSPVYLVTYAQGLFALAEAAKRGWIAGGDAVAENYYNMAIEASVQQWNNGEVTGLEEMMQQPEVAYDPARAMEQIGYQRWVHLFMNGYEAWAEWRRTGYPALEAPEDNAGRAIPLREAYPSQEAQNNSQNYKEAVQAAFNGQDDLYGRLWWDK